MRNNIQRYQCLICNKSFTFQQKLNPAQIWLDYTEGHLNLIIDVTFFGREFGVMVFMDSLTKKVVYHQIMRTEKDAYYQLAMNALREKAILFNRLPAMGVVGCLTIFRYADTALPISSSRHCDS